MELECPHLPLASFWDREDDDRCVFLVRALDAISLCRRGEYEQVRPSRAIWEFERVCDRLSWELRTFLLRARPFHFDMFGARNEDLPRRIVRAIEHGDIVGLRPCRKKVGEDDPTLVQRQLVRQIEAHPQGRLTAGGRQYKLVPGLDLPAIPDRNRYEVVSRADAERVLGELGKKAAPGLADLLTKAREALTPDWRPPFSPTGLVCLRRLVAARETASSAGPAVSPSQFRALMEEEKPLQFFARFVDERGEPVAGFAGDFEHGSDPKCDMTFSGSGFARMGDLKRERQAWLRIPDKANQTIVEDLKKRWRKMRGEVDDAWKEDEACLVEVVFNQGRLPELQLEAEKKHTFMLRPPVALARLHGMYFDTNKCFLLPSAVPSLKQLVEKYALHPDSEVLIVGHTDTAGSQAFNLELSADRADALKAFLRDDADAWLSWYDEGVRASKRWGRHEDLMMIDAVVPDEEFGKGGHVAAYQAWHNGDAGDARIEDEGQARVRPEGWEELKVDGIMGPKTRRQLILDYMNLDGTTLDDDVRIVTYGCGERFPLESEAAEVAEEAEDDQEVQFNRRVEVFFFAKPFGILPPVPGVAEGESPKQASKAAADDELYLEWRRRTSREYAIDTETEGLRLQLCDSDFVPYANRPFAFCLEGCPEIRGTTDADGFVHLHAQPLGAKGYVMVWPDDALPDETFRWDLAIEPTISPATPLGASARLANLGYFFGEPTEEMTDEVRDALRCFESDFDDLEVTGEIEVATCNRLRALGDCEPDDHDDDESGGPSDDGL